MNLGTTNNFDLIRLFAASEVAINHSAVFLGYNNPLFNILYMFPGVPIFFFVSGYLIYGSFEKSSSDAGPLKNFFIKRILRLYPALFLCLTLTVLSLWQNGYLQEQGAGIKDFLIWLLPQATFFQFYQPEFLRDYGVGSINGSLWTIAVEIQFYILTPIIFLIFSRNNKYAIIAIMLVLVTANVLNSQFNDRETLPSKLFNVSFVPWLYMFLLGALTYKYQSVVRYVIRVPFLVVFAVFLVTYYITLSLGLNWTNFIHPVGYLALVALIIKCAYTLPELSDKLLKRNDLSYGIYIMHMPIVNYMLYANITGFEGFVYTILFTIFFATISWFVVERPSLRMKKFALRNI